MQYVLQSLAPDEEIVHIGRYHWMYNVAAAFSIVWGVFFCVALLVGSILLFTKFGVPTVQYSPEMGSSWLDYIRGLHPAIKLISLMFFVLGLLKFAKQMVDKVTTEIAITTSRLIYKRGLVARYVGEISIDRIEGVNVLQGFWGRIFDYGRVVVRGMGVGEVILPPLSRPVIFRKAIEKARTL
jgi:uncharacterized membrane protein YdbT with pleckstrin-like domain